MIPIIQQYGSKISIIEDVLMRTVDDHWSEEAACILTAIVRVIPRSAIEIRLKSIRERFSRSDRALLNSWDAIKPRGSSLKNSMPMDSGPFFGLSDLIMHRDLKSISPIGFNGWPRELTVD